MRPQPPPAELGKSKQQLLRFVSLIPYLDDSSLGAKLDVWNTSDSFLELCAGDSEEHAVLLCNYLLHEGKEAYVVLGTGIASNPTPNLKPSPNPNLKPNPNPNPNLKPNPNPKPNPKPNRNPNPSPNPNPNPSPSPNPNPNPPNSN